MGNDKDVAEKKPQRSGRFNFSKKDAKREKTVVKARQESLAGMVFVDIVLVIFFAPLVGFILFVIIKYFSDMIGGSGPSLGYLLAEELENLKISVVPRAAPDPVVWGYVRDFFRGVFRELSDAELSTVFTILAAVGIAATVALSDAEEKLHKINFKVDPELNGAGDADNHVSVLTYYRSISMFLFLFRPFLLILLPIAFGRLQFTLGIATLFFYIYLFIQSQALDRYIIAAIKTLYDQNKWERAQKSVELVTGQSQPADSHWKNIQIRYRNNSIGSAQFGLVVLLNILTIFAIPIFLWNISNASVWKQILVLGIYLLVVVLVSLIRHKILLVRFYPAVKLSIESIFPYVGYLIFVILYESFFFLLIVLSYKENLPGYFQALLIGIFSSALAATILDIWIVCKNIGGKKPSYYLGRSLIRAHQIQVARRESASATDVQKNFVQRLCSWIKRKWKEFSNPSEFKIDNPQGYFPLKESIDEETRQIQYSLPDMGTFESERLPGYFIPDVWDYFWTKEERTAEESPEGKEN